MNEKQLKAIVMALLAPPMGARPINEAELKTLTKSTESILKQAGIEDDRKKENKEN